MSDTLTSRNIIFTGIIIVLIALGKVSTGFMYASLAGLYLVFKYPKDKRIYLLGFVWLIFFLFYFKLFSTSFGAGLTRFNFSQLTLSHFVSQLLYYHSDSFRANQNIMIQLSIVMTGLLSFLLKNKNTSILLYSTLSSYFILILLTSLNTGLNESEIGYIYLGLSYIVNLFTFQIITFEFKQRDILSGATYQNIFMLSLALSALYITSFYVSSDLSLLPKKMAKSVKHLDRSAFTYINNMWDDKHYLTLHNMLLKKVHNTWLTSQHGPLL